MNKGKIVQVIGPVVDVEFPDNLPGIYNALTVDFKVQDQPVKLTLEGETVFICCPGCKDQAISNPQKTVDRVKELRSQPRQTQPPKDEPRCPLVPKLTS